MIAGSPSHTEWETIIMTLRELKDSQASMLGAKLMGEDLMSLEEGTVLFGGTVASGKNPQLERAVITSGFRYVANVSHNFGVDCLGLTKNGYAAIYTYTKSDLCTNRFLFRIQTPEPDHKSILCGAILVMMQAGLIEIQSSIKVKPELTADVNALSVFTDEALSVTMPQGDWGDGPKAAMAECIISALENGDLKFKQYDEW